jgi:hypothetical protein
MSKGGRRATIRFARSLPKGVSTRLNTTTVNPRITEAIEWVTNIPKVSRVDTLAQFMLGLDEMATAKKPMNKKLSNMGYSPRQKVSNFSRVVETKNAETKPATSPPSRFPSTNTGNAKNACSIKAKPTVKK